jgi:hypothetical protein
MPGMFRYSQNLFNLSAPKPHMTDARVVLLVTSKHPLLAGRVAEV